MRNRFKELAGYGAGLLGARRKLDELNAEKGRAFQPKPQAQPPMSASRRLDLYRRQRNGGRLTARQERRFMQKQFRLLKKAGEL